MTQMSTNRRICGQIMMTSTAEDSSAIGINNTHKNVLDIGRERDVRHKTEIMFPFM